MPDRTPPIALITGGSRGLGRSTALQLARKGCDVALTYHSRKDEAEAVVDQIAALGRKAVALQLDTSDTGRFAAFATGLQAALTELRGTADLDFLVNNAGTGIHVPFAETTEAQFDAMMTIHLKGVFFLTQQLLPMIRDGGKIINLSSGLARFSLPGYAAYATMKGGVEAMTRYLARELGPRGISANVVAPGAIETDFAGGAVRDVPEVNRYIASQTAMGRVGLPDDIGGAISSLLMGDMGWMTGQRIEVSGGMLI